MEPKHIDAYSITANNIPLQIQIYSIAGHPVPYYHLSLLNLTKETKLIIEKIREQIINEINFDLMNKDDEGGEEGIKKQFKTKILSLLEKNFPELDKEVHHFLANYVVITSLGLAEIEFLLKDPHLEEIVINNAKEPAWVYHRDQGWLKTNIRFEDENKIRHFATMIGRNVDKGITLLEPLLDAHLETGDRVNATLSPITAKGNTITIRKFSEKPWTIVDFLNNGTTDFNSAALLWMAIEFELSILIAGGTGSGKTSFLNVLCNFFPPNQRIITIEDTRELRLPSSLHWVPMQSRLPNPEGKGAISILDCMINTLRMRPDRILVGEVRRQKEVEVMFEAMHTGHSVYATVHASNVDETFMRLTNPPLNVPKNMLASLGLIVVQNRNRRTGLRRTFQIADLDTDGTPRLIFQHNAVDDTMMKVADPSRMIETIGLYSGMDKDAVYQDLQQKIMILEWLVKNKVPDVNEIGEIMSEFYTQKDVLMDKITGGFTNTDSTKPKTPGR
ncbi:MAG: Flp pilus assembly complex ATPase component TadA [Nanoarchaeota archaeon]|nr:Flp pilus assembly complex ATPase component TadA [Nanoarchaeota archaeon]